MIQLLKINPDNPRVISKKDFEKLKKSLKEFPKMLELRPIVYDDNYVVLGGNMRLKALRELVKDGFEVKEEYFINASELTEAQKREFVIKDNINIGEWDYDLLSSDWDDLPLEEWGLAIQADDDFYTRNIESPIYEASSVVPSIESLVDKNKTNELLKRIDASSLADDVKEFLRLAAYRHLVFNYSLIADYYASADEEIRELFEESALVIIDYKKAIENGFVILSKNIANLEDNE